MRKAFTAAALALACLTIDAAHAESSTKISGKAFIDFTRIDAELDGIETDASTTGVDVTRFYVTVEHTFDEVWSANITTDFQYLNAVTSVNATGTPVTVTTSTNSSAEVFIKKAYVQAKVADELVVRVGSADMPWIGFVEGLYGYRYIEKTMTDRLGVAASADWGVHASGEFADGRLHYAAAIVNGRGFKDTRRAKSMDVEGRVHVIPIDGVTLGLGYRTGKLGLETATNPAERTARRWDGLIAYVHERLRVGAEYFTAKNYGSHLVQQGNPAPSVVLSDEAEGESIWGSFNFTRRLAGFARYERVDTSKELNPEGRNRFSTVGAVFAPRKNIDIALAWKQTKIDVSAASEAKLDEVGVWSSVTF